MAQKQWLLLVIGVKRCFMILVFLDNIPEVGARSRVKLRSGLVILALDVEVSNSV